MRHTLGEEVSLPRAGLRGAVLRMVSTDRMPKRPIVDIGPQLGTQIRPAWGVKQDSNQLPRRFLEAIAFVFAALALQQRVQLTAFTLFATLRLPFY